MTLLFDFLLTVELLYSNLRFVICHIGPSQPVPSHGCVTLSAGLFTSADLQGFKVTKEQLTQGLN